MVAAPEYSVPEALKKENLSQADYDEICRRLGRAPNRAELGMFGVMWSEHCCYRNSRPLLQGFPTTGPRILVGPGENAGVVDLGEGQRLAFKIESHNHPSAVEPFQGALTLFLLDLGMVAASRLSVLRQVGLRLVLFGVGLALFHGALGVYLGLLVGLGVGGAAVLGAMAASASYIAAPAAVRIALPEANPSLYLTASLAVTFPFNLVLGIPLYRALAVLWGG